MYIIQQCLLQSAGCTLYPQHLPCNWNFVPFDQLSPIPLPLSPASCDHTSISMILGFCLFYVICLFIFNILRAWIICCFCLISHTIMLLSLILVSNLRIFLFYMTEYKRCVYVYVYISQFLCPSIARWIQVVSMSRLL